MAKNKINWLLILQGWAMLWVVVGHAQLDILENSPAYAGVLYDIAYSFHMPLFMLVSGWLFYLTRLKSYVREPAMRGGREWSYFDIIKDKTMRLLLPGLVFSIVALALKLAFPGEINRQVGVSFQEIAHSYLFPNDNPMRELWFIATLFWFFLFTPLWRVLLYKIEYLTVALLVLAYYFHPNIEFLCIGCVFKYALWFYMGLIISKHSIVENVLDKNPWLSLLLGLSFWSIGKVLSISIITTFGGIVFSFGFALIANRHISNVFFSFRDYTYQIFLMGIFAQMLVKILYRHISFPYVIGYILCILMGLYMPVVVTKIILRINWKPLVLSVGLKPITNIKEYENK